MRRLKLRVADCWAGGADSSGVGLKVSEQRPWVLAIAWPGEEGRETGTRRAVPRAHSQHTVGSFS